MEKENETLSENEQKEILVKFASELIENLVDTPPDIAQITHKRLWDMYERF